MWGRAAPGCADATSTRPTLSANNSKAKTMTSRANFTGQSPLKMTAHGPHRATSPRSATWLHGIAGVSLGQPDAPINQVRVPVDRRAAGAGRPDAVAPDAAIKLAAVLVLLEEGGECVEERHAAAGPKACPGFAHRR